MNQSIQRTIYIHIGWTLVMTAMASAQQAANPDYQPKLNQPSFAAGSGPTIAIDEAHHNFHTRDGRYAPFSRLLTADGFRVQRNQGSFKNGIDADVDVLVIANALHESNRRHWSTPTPSAFTASEIDQIEAWVRNGGSLLLIADHMPFPGAAGDLAQRFGIEMSNGFAFEIDESGGISRNASVFTAKSKLLGNHPIISGTNQADRIMQVATFTGQAFRVRNPEFDWNGLLILSKGTVSLEPAVAWEFNADTPRRDVSGWYQGACLRIGAGRIVLFGEAAMFTSQRIGNTGRTNGMTAKPAVDNQQLLLNIMHWLTGRLVAEDGR